MCTFDNGDDDHWFAVKTNLLASGPELGRSPDVIAFVLQFREVILTIAKKVGIIVRLRGDCFMEFSKYVGLFDRETPRGVRVQ